MKLRDPVKHCGYYKQNGCASVDGLLCPCKEMKGKEDK